MLQPARPSELISKHRLQVGWETVERSDANQRISVWCLHPHPCILDSTQKTRLEEMPGNGPGSAENLVELLLLLGLCNIHFAMHGVPMLVSLASGPLGLSGRCLPLFLFLQFIFTNELLKRFCVERGYLSLRRASRWRRRIGGLVCCPWPLLRHPLGLALRYLSLRRASRCRC